MRVLYSRPLSQPAVPELPQEEAPLDPLAELKASWRWGRQEPQEILNFVLEELLPHRLKRCLERYHRTLRRHGGTIWFIRRRNRRREMRAEALFRQQIIEAIIAGLHRFASVRRSHVKLPRAQLDREYVWQNEVEKPEEVARLLRAQLGD